MTRYLRGEREDVPDLPKEYFDPRTEAILERIAARADRHRAPDAQSRMPNDWALRKASIDSWQAAAVQIYRNWLERVAALKTAS